MALIWAPGRQQISQIWCVYWAFCSLQKGDSYENDTFFSFMEGVSMRGIGPLTLITNASVLDEPSCSSLLGSTCLWNHFLHAKAPWNVGQSQRRHQMSAASGSNLQPFPPFPRSLCLARQENNRESCILCTLSACWACLWKCLRCERLCNFLLYWDAGSI